MTVLAGNQQATMSETRLPVCCHSQGSLYSSCKSAVGLVVILSAPLYKLVPGSLSLRLLASQAPELWQDSGLGMHLLGMVVLATLTQGLGLQMTTF